MFIQLGIAQTSRFAPSLAPPSSRSLFAIARDTHTHVSFLRSFRSLYIRWFTKKGYFKNVIGFGMFPVKVARAWKKYQIDFLKFSTNVF